MHRFKRKEKAQLTKL